MTTAPIRFGIVGSGWRADFFARLARLLPERLEVAGVVWRCGGGGRPRYRGVWGWAEETVGALG
ncbi:hypothetical protein ACFV2J_05360, partial [Streptomyces sp. NPDC059668]